GMLLRVRSSRLLHSLIGQRSPAKPADTTLLDRARADGFACLRFSDAEIEAIKRVVAPGFARLDDRRAAIPVERRKFDDNVYWCTRSKDPDAFATVEAIFQRYGICETASAYLGRPTGVKHVNLQINDPEYAFWKRQIPDSKLPDARTTYLH